MAGAGITIGVAADTREAAKGATDLAKGFDQVADTLDDVAKSSDKAGNKLEASMRDAQRETKDTATAFKQLAKEQRDAASAGGEDFSRVTRKSMKDSSNAVKEFGGEAKQNIGETFSSFRGDATDFAQIFQDTLGGLTSGLEGIPGVAAVAAGAAGIGLLIGAMENGQQQTQQFKQDVADLATELIDAGNTGEVSIGYLVDKLKTLATTGDDAGVTLTKLNDLSRRSKNSFEDVADAYAGNSKALGDLISHGRERLEQLQREGAAVDTSAAAHDQNAGKITDEANAQKELNSYLEQAKSKADEAAKSAKLYAESGAAEMQAKATAVENIGQAYQDAAGDVQDYTDKESGAFDTDAYIQGFQKKAQELADYATNLQKAAVTLTPAALSFLETQGTDAASTLVSAYVNGTAAQQANLAKVWNQAGTASSTSYLTGFKGGIPSSIAGPEIVATWRVDRSALDAAIRSQANVTVPVKLVDPRSGKAIF